MAKVGSVDFVIAGSTHVSRYAPVLISVSFPYMWKDAETMFRLLDGDVGKRLQELVAEAGARRSWAGGRTASGTSRTASGRS